MVPSIGSARRLLTAALLAVTAAGPLAAQTPRQQVDEVLSSPAAETLGAQELAARLDALSGSVVPVLVELLEEREPRHREALLLALAAAPRDSVSIALRQRAGLARDVRTRLALLGVLRHVGTRRDLTVFLDLADPSDARGTSVMVLGADLRGALTALYRRDPPPSRQITQLIVDAHPAHLLPMVGATQGLPLHRRVEVLCRLFGQRQGLDPLLLRELGTACQSGSFRPDEDYSSAVRPFLQDLDPELVALAAHAAGVLQDHESIEILIELLDVDDPDIQRAAHHALRALTTQGFPAQSDRWRAWYERELRWHDERALDARIALRSGGRADVFAALREIGIHRLYRHDLADEVGDVLFHQDDDVVLQAIAVLRALGSTRPADALVETLDFGSPEVTAAAHACLVELTGRNLPPDSDRWRKALLED